MADGSLRITLEFDPRYAKDAYALFGARGTPVAIAALTVDASTQAAQQETIAEPKTKAGELCVMACTFCKEDQFWVWMTRNFNCEVNSEDDAKYLILHVCRIESRKELDTNHYAAERFHIEIRRPYLAWKSKPVPRAA
jgi:hypothetical protein